MKEVALMTNQILERIERHRLIPVIKLDRAKDALPLAASLIEGGLPVAEITFRTNAAEESIRLIGREFPEILLGAGSVTSAAQVDAAVKAGAAFIVTAGFSHIVVRDCIERNIPVFPGVCTPTEILSALEYGLEVLKFFPAKQYGGMDTLKALNAPFPNVRFIPTGGVDCGNLLSYLSMKCVLACGGSWMVKDTLVQNGDFEEIQRLTADAISLIKNSAIEK